MYFFLSRPKIEQDLKETVHNENIVIIYSSSRGSRPVYVYF